MCRPLPVTIVIDDPRSSTDVTTAEMRKRALRWWSDGVPNRINADAKVHLLGPYRVKGSE